ncbi:DUF397 domain-containing protein [Streptomyces sp. ISL-111]|nr:DUF397 domain-containing protein [Streptomyces sp. ISL-111]
MQRGHRWGLRQDAATVDAVHVRDSKRAEGPTVAVGAEEWAAFLRIVGRG